MSFVTKVRSKVVWFLKFN